MGFLNNVINKIKEQPQKEGLLEQGISPQDMPLPNNLTFKVAGVNYRMEQVYKLATPMKKWNMTNEQRYDAAKKAALDYFAAAGYTVKNGKVTAAPEGAAMAYEVLVSGGGKGDHPTFMALTLASAALKELGFQLIVTDISNFSELTNAVNAGTAELFALAWTASADPDMYQIYHSQGSSNEKAYHLKDKQLDELIMLARQSTDQSYRKTLYQACLDMISDWAVEIPMYQRQNTVLFSTQRVDMSTVTPDITTFWGWENDIESLQMR